MTTYKQQQCGGSFSFFFFLEHVPMEKHVLIMLNLLPAASASFFQA